MRRVAAPARRQKKRNINNALVPDDGLAAAVDERKADDAADDRVRRRDGQLHVRRDQQPRRRGGQRAQHAVRKDVGTGRKVGGVGDAAADGVGHGAAEEDGAERLHDGGDEAGPLHLERVAPCFCCVCLFLCLNEGGCQVSCVCAPTNNRATEYTHSRRRAGAVIIIHSTHRQTWQRRWRRRWRLL